MKIKRSADIPDRDAVQWVQVKPKEFWVEGAKRKFVFANVDQKYVENIYEAVIVESFGNYELKFKDDFIFIQENISIQIYYSIRMKVFLLKVEYAKNVLETLLKYIKPVGKL